MNIKNFIQSVKDISRAVKDFIKYSIQAYDEERMKQLYGRLSGEYRPKTLQEIKDDNPDLTSQEHQWLFEYEMIKWNTTPEQEAERYKHLNQ